jgi:FkbM family methyltransferase
MHTATHSLTQIDLILYKIFPVGLSSKREVVKLYGDNNIASGASIIENFRTSKDRYKEIYTVHVVTGDSIFCDENINAINFIKVDVEGAELDVMLGLKETMQQFHPVAIIEILPVYTLENENGKMRKERQDKLLQFMFSLNYNLFLVNEKEINIEPLDYIPVHGDMGKTNYLFIPVGEVKNFTDLIVARS